MNAARRGKPKIKPPKRHGPEFNVDVTWSQLSKNIREIQNHRASNLSFEENHRYAYNMVLYKHSELLYKGTCQLVAEWLDKLANEVVIPTFPSASTQDPMQLSQEGEIFLKALRSVWDDHKESMERLGQILKYMDRVYSQGTEVPKLWDAGLDIFLRHILSGAIKEHLITAVLSQIKLEREGYVINRSAVKSCVEVCGWLAVDKNGTTVYKRDVEPVLLKESEAFYRLEGDNLAGSYTAPEFLNRAESRLAAEESRTNHYLQTQTAEPLRRILEDNLLTRHLTEIICMQNSGLDEMVDQDQFKDLARLYRLFSLVPQGVPTMRKHVKASILRRGKDLNVSSLNTDTSSENQNADSKEAQEPTKSGNKARPLPQTAQTLNSALTWVQKVLDLKGKFDEVWRESFNCDRDLESTLNEAFEDFINSHPKAPEFISLFIDEHLRKGLKGKSETEVDAILDKTMTVFRYVTEKDVFERYYKGHLAKRLLNSRSVSDDAERGMIAKLKIECGFQFTSKLEGMFNDMRVSSDTMDDYRTHLSKSATANPRVDISVTVMTATSWPVSSTGVSCTLPLELLEACQSFEKFYLSRHSGRRLTWQPSLGNADVKTTFKKGNHSLNVSTFALVILLLFQDLEDGEELTYPEIKQATSIIDGELQRHLQSLACGKYKILKKHPPGRDVSTEDSFSFNNDFTAPLQKIKIGTIASKVESSEENKETQDRIEEERTIQTEACIVRIMKDRKHMTHTELVNETTRQLSLRFQPNPLNIKKRIEALIDREYLERCEDRKSYNYLA